MKHARAFLPNMVTLSGLLLAFASMLLVARGDYATAAWLLLLCTILDKLDGTLARLLGTSSELGVQLDSLSDLVSFVVAPAFLWASVLLEAEVSLGKGLWLAMLFPSLALYLAGGALRLAKFNLGSEDHGAIYYFSGLASTMAAAFSLTFFLFLDAWELLPSYALAVPPVLALLGLAMNLPLLFPKAKVTSNRVMTAFFMVTAVMAIPLILLRLLPEVLFGLSLTYVILGFFCGNVYPGTFLRELSDEEHRSRK